MPHNTKDSELLSSNDRVAKNNAIHSRVHPYIPELVNQGAAEMKFNEFHREKVFVHVVSKDSLASALPKSLKLRD